MVLRLYNTRTRKKAPFAPLTPGIVKMYVCGPTTYDYSHLGHARSYIDFDTARRYLEFLGHRVTYVQNFTDIEEVIIRRAKEAGKAPLAYAQYYIDSFLEDMRALNVKPPDHMPKVSEHIPEITALIARLVDRGYAYPVDGDVYFRTRKAKHSFGILSHQKFEDIVVESAAVTSPTDDPRGPSRLPGRGRPPLSAESSLSRGRRVRCGVLRPDAQGIRRDARGDRGRDERERRRDRGKGHGPGGTDPGRLLQSDGRRPEHARCDLSSAAAHGSARRGAGHVRGRGPCGRRRVSGMRSDPRSLPEPALTARSVPDSVVRERPGGSLM